MAIPEATLERLERLECLACQAAATADPAGRASQAASRGAACLVRPPQELTRLAEQRATLPAGPAIQAAAELIQECFLVGASHLEACPGGHLEACLGSHLEACLGGLGSPLEAYLASQAGQLACQLLAIPEAAQAAAA